MLRAIEVDLSVVVLRAFPHASNVLLLEEEQSPLLAGYLMGLFESLDLCLKNRVVCLSC